MRRPSKSRHLQVECLTEPPKFFAPFLPAKIVLDLVIGRARGAASPTFNAELPVSGARFLPLVLRLAIQWEGTELMVMARRLWCLISTWVDIMAMVMAWVMDVAVAQFPSELATGNAGPKVVNITTSRRMSIVCVVELHARAPQSLPTLLFHLQCISQAVTAWGQILAWVLARWVTPPVQVLSQLVQVALGLELGLGNSLADLPPVNTLYLQVWVLLRVGMVHQ